MFRSKAKPFMVPLYRVEVAAGRRSVCVTLPQPRLRLTDVRYVESTAA